VIDPDDTDDLSRWGEIMNKAHGYGGVFNYETADDKAIVELSTAREWCESIAAEFSLTVGEPEHNPDDPPDCYVTVEGQRLGVELVQLVEPEHKRRAAKDETPYAGQLFQDMQWSKERLVLKLNEVVQKKGNKYKLRGARIDVLLVHTAETWLSSSQAREWLADVQIKPHPNIASAYLLFEYEPGRDVQHWPVIGLFGDLGVTR
jgi:hypothetical protein